MRDFYQMPDEDVYGDKITTLPADGLQPDVLITQYPSGVSMSRLYPDYNTMPGEDGEQVDMVRPRRWHRLHAAGR